LEWRDREDMTDREFWLLIYRALMMIASAVKKYKLTD